jgi:SET family sugar efflux transporter-like MFS transporter
VPAEGTSVKRSGQLLIQLAALAWGFQFAFLNPALALVLATLLHATDAQVGLALALYNASGFVVSLVMPAWADRRGNYLTWMLICGASALALTIVLLLSGSLLVAIVGLVLVGGPAGVGSSLLFAFIRAQGYAPAAIMNTRAMISLAWVAGPPAAMLIAGWFGIRWVLVAIVIMSLIAMAVVLMLRRGSTVTTGSTPVVSDASQPIPLLKVAAVFVAFVALMAANAAVTSGITLFTVKDLRLGEIWGGVALAVSALAEIPALVLLGRLTARHNQVTLLLVGCAVGVVYFVVMAVVHDPFSLVGAQVLKAWWFANVTGIGITLFQDIIPRPGLASGLYTNTVRVGAVFSGGIIALAGTPAGFSGVFLVCAALTAVALVITVFVRGRRRTNDATGAPVARLGDPEPEY